MLNAKRRGAVASICWLAGTTSALLIAAAAAVPSAELPGRPAGDDGKSRLHPSSKYLGNAGCTGNGCHSGEAKKQSGQLIGDECLIYDETDPHSKAFKTLGNDKSKKIAESMKLGDAAKADKCISCHGMPVPDAQRGEKFGDPGKNAVGCESCHGPAEKWNEPHQKEGWFDKERAKGPKAMFDSWGGLRDTRHLATRATMCVSCHLKIDKDMVTAGHPPLNFEMYYYNNYQFKPKKYKMHWDEQPNPLRRGQMWALGQLAAFDVSEGEDKAVFAAGKEVVKSAYGSDDMAAVNTVKLDKSQAVSAAKALLAKADAFKANKHAREVITNGMDALVSSCYSKLEDVPEKCPLVDDVLKKEGDAWVTDLKAMAEFAK